MRNRIFVRSMPEEDLVKLIEWLGSTPENLVDFEVLKYPATFILKAFTKDKDLVFMPVQPVPMLESLAIGKETTALEAAQALKELVHAMATDAYGKGQRELFFACKNQATADFACRNGFELVNIPMYRLKLPL